MIQKTIVIEPISKQEALSSGIIPHLMHILNKCQGMSGIIGFFSEQDIFNSLTGGKILLINKTGTADKIKTIGVAVIISESRPNETATYSLAFEQETKSELIIDALKALPRFAYTNKALTKISIIVAKQGALEKQEALIALLGDSGFILETELQKALKTPEGFKNAYLCSSSMNGRGIEPVVLPAAIDTEKDKIIAGLKFQLKQKEELAKTLEANLSKKSEELVKATDQLHLMVEELKKSGEKTDINTAADKIAKLEAVIIRLKNEAEKQAELLKQKSDQIVTQEKIIEELKKGADSKEGDSLKPENEETETVDNSVQKAEIEIKAPEISVEELEKLIREAGVSSKTNGMSAIGEVLKCVILNPCIEYQELSKKTDTAQSYVSQNATHLATLGLIVIDRSSYPIKLNPVKDIIKNLRDLAQNRKPEIKLGLNSFDIYVLQSVLAKPDQGLKHKEIIEKIHEQQQNRSQSSIQYQVSASVRKLAAEPLKMVTNDRVDGNEKIVKPVMEKIKELPKELQKELGIKEQESPKTKPKESAEKTPGEKKDIEDLLNKKLTGSGKKIHPNRFALAIEALSLILQNPDGIRREILKRQLKHSYSEFNSIIELLKELNLIILDKGENEVQHNIIKPAKNESGIKELMDIVQTGTVKQKNPLEETTDLTQKVEAALKIINSGEISMIKGILMKSLCERAGVDPENNDEYTAFMNQLKLRCHLSGATTKPDMCFVKPKLKRADGTNIVATDYGDKDKPLTIAEVVKRNNLNEHHGRILVLLRNNGGKIKKSDLNGTEPEKNEQYLKDMEEAKIIEIVQENGESVIAIAVEYKRLIQQ